MTTAIEKRLILLRKSLSNQNFDALLVLVGENRRYLSGFTGEDSQFDESAGALLITSNRQILATDSRFELQAESPGMGCTNDSSSFQDLRTGFAPHGIRNINLEADLRAGRHFEIA